MSGINDTKSPITPQIIAAYKDGYEAMQAGWRITENPHRVLSPKYDMWLSGWLDANEFDTRAHDDLT